MEWLAQHVDPDPQSAMERAFAAAVVADQADARAAAERAGALELRAEERQFAFRQSGIRPGALTERAQLIGDKTTELADLQARASKVEQDIVELRRAQEFDAEQLQLAQESASRSAPFIPGLGTLPQRSVEDQVLLRAHARSALARIGVRR